MSNWTSATPTRDQALADSFNYGEWRQLSHFIDTTSTADVGIAAGGGGILLHRYSAPITVPAVTAPVTGYCVTQLDIFCSSLATGAIVGLEVPLGTLTISGNVFSGGASMPTRTVAGSSLQLASPMPVLYVISTLTATTPTITFTYTNQSGTTGQTGTIVLPTTAAVNSAFLLNKRLAAGDTGIRAITNISTSTGSAGSLRIVGFMPISAGFSGSAASGQASIVEPLSSPLPIIKLLPNDVLATYGMSAGNSQIIMNLVATPET